MQVSLSVFNQRITEALNSQMAEDELMFYCELVQTGSAVISINRHLEYWFTILDQGLTFHVVDPMNQLEGYDFASDDPIDLSPFVSDLQSNEDYETNELIDDIDFELLSIDESDFMDKITEDE